MASISPPVKKRFPTYTHLIESGLLTGEETKILEESTVEKPPYVVPLIWAIAVCHQVEFQEEEWLAYDSWYDISLILHLSDAGRWRGSWGERGTGEYRFHEIAVEGQNWNNDRLVVIKL